MALAISEGSLQLVGVQVTPSQPRSQPAAPSSLPA